MVTHQLQVERRTGKVRRPETDVLPLCHATTQGTECVERIWELIPDTFGGTDWRSGGGTHGVVSARERRAVGSSARQVDVVGHLPMRTLLLLMMMDDVGRVEHRDQRDGDVRALEVDGKVGDEHRHGEQTTPGT